MNENTEFIMIDSLCHLDSRNFKKIEDAINALLLNAEKTGVQKIFLANIPGRKIDGVQGFENEAVLEKIKQKAKIFEFFPGINPSDKNALQLIQKYKDDGARGIKLHPRLHAFKIESQKCLEIAKFAGSLGMPLIICSFMDGINLKLGNMPESFGRFADQCPDTKILMAHAGGHKIIDSMMVMKTCPNIYLDLSFSLLYYRECHSIMESIKYVLKSSNAKRILWGTDYPDRDYCETIKLSMAEFRKMALSAEISHKILVSNPLEFIGKNTYAL